MITKRPQAPGLVRSVAMDIIWTLLTCGIYNCYVQYKQMEAMNEILGYGKYSFMHWSLLTLVTCGLYHIYYEYRMSEDLVKMVPGTPEYEPILAVVLSAFGFWIIADAIQQSHINRYFGRTTL